MKNKKISIFAIVGSILVLLLLIIIAVLLNYRTGFMSTSKLNSIIFKDAGIKENDAYIIKKI